MKDRDAGINTDTNADSVPKHIPETSAGNDAVIPILINTDFDQADLDRLRQIDPRVQATRTDARSVADLHAWADDHGYDLSRVRVFCGGYSNPIGEPSQRDIFPNLAWLQLTSAGYNKFESTWLFGPDGPLVTNASGIHASQMGEWSLGAILAWRWRFATARRLQSQATWAKEKRALFRRDNIRGMTLGVVGYGAIGREVARLAHAFGMEILALKSNPERRADRGFSLPGVGDPEGVLPKAWYGVDQLYDLLGQSDVVLLALPLLDETRHIMNADSLAAMKQDALLLNVGRGGLIDQDALVRTLEEEQIFATLDVTDPEPLPSDHPLWRADPERFLLTPHVSGISTDYHEKLSMLMAANLQRWLVGEELYNVVSGGGNA